MKAGRNLELESLIRADRVDPGPYMVYGDWLAENGNPRRGELVGIQARIAAEHEHEHRQRLVDRAARLIADNAVDLLGLACEDPVTELTQGDLVTSDRAAGFFKWHFGFVRYARPSSRAETSDGFSWSKLFAHPSFAFVETLAFEALRGGELAGAIGAMPDEVRCGIRQLLLDHCVVDEAGARALATIAGLRTLVLSNNPAGNHPLSMVSHLRGLPLQHLQLEDINNIAKGSFEDSLATVSIDLQELRSLTLRVGSGYEGGIWDEARSRDFVAKLPRSIEQLTMAGISSVSMSLLDALDSLPNLARVRIIPERGLPVETHGVVALTYADWRNRDQLDRYLERSRVGGLYFKSVTLTDQDVERLGRLPNLRALIIRNAGASFTGAGLSALRHLRHLHLYRCHAVTDDALAVLSNLPCLEQIHLESSDSLTARAVRNLPRQTRAAQLDFQKLDSESFASVCTLAQLEWLDLNRVLISNQQLAQILQRLDRLSYLCVNIQRLTHEGLELFLSVGRPLHLRIRGKTPKREKRALLSPRLDEELRSRGWTVSEWWYGQDLDPNLAFVSDQLPGLTATL